MSGVRHATIQLNADMYNAGRAVPKKSLLEEQIDRKRRQTIACSVERAETLSRDFQVATRRAESITLSIDASASQEVKTIHQKITELVTSQNKRIEEQGAQFQAEIVGLNDEQSRVKLALLDSSASQENLKKEIQSLRDTLNSVEERERKKETLAECIIQNAKALIIHIDGLEHERYAPGDLDKLRNQLVDSQINFSNGVFEGALVGAQSIIAGAMELKEKVVQKQMEHEKWLAIAIKMLTELEGRYQQADSMEYELKTSLGIETVSARVNVFSDGRLSCQQNELSIIANSIRGKEDEISTDELKRCIDKLDVINNDLQDTLIIAHENYIKACQREEVLNNVADTLSKVYGMEFVEAAYWNGHGDAANSAIHAKFNNSFTGDEIVLVITPQKDDHGVVMGESLDLDITEAGIETRSVIDNRSNEIMNAISTNTPGLKVESSICEAQTIGRLSPRKYIGDMDKVNRGIAHE